MKKFSKSFNKVLEQKRGKMFEGNFLLFTNHVDTRLSSLSSQELLTLSAIQWQDHVNSSRVDRL